MFSQFAGAVANRSDLTSSFSIIVMFLSMHVIAVQVLAQSSVGVVVLAGGLVPQTDE